MKSGGVGYWNGLNKTIGVCKNWMCVELLGGGERIWCGVLGKGKVGVEL